MNIVKSLLHWYRLLPWLFLIIALPASYFIWSESRALQFSAKKNSFEQALNQSANDLINHFTPFEQAMFGVRSLFNSSTLVEESEFKQYVGDLLETQGSPGLIHIGYAKYINPIQPHTFQHVEEKFRHKILSYDQYSLHAPIIFSDAESQTDFGNMHDVFENPHLKAVMQQAALTNQLLLTHPVGVHKASKELLSMLLPVYKGEARESGASSVIDYEAVDGWVYMNIDLEPIFKALFQSGQDIHIRYALYSRSNGQTDEMLYENVEKSTDQSLFDAQKEIELYGHKWVLTANTLPSFERNIDYSYSNSIGIAALVVLAGLTSILFLLISRVSAFDRLNELNKQLAKSDERWRFALESSESGVWDWDIANNHMNYSTRWREMFGFETVEFENTQEEWQRLIHADDRKRVIHILQAYLQGDYESYSVEYRFRCKDGWNQY